MKRFFLASGAALVALASSASEAHANGRFPETNQLVFSKTDPSFVLLRVTFGLLVSHDRGASFDWVCEQAIGYNGVEDPMYATTPSGRLVATTFQGMTTSEDQACSWKFLGDPSAPAVFVDLTQNPNDGKNILAFSSGYRSIDDAGNSIFDSQLWETTDEGKSFAKLGSPLSTRLIGYTLDVTKPDPNRVYLTVRDPGRPNTAILMRSKDHGLTWTDEPFPLVGTETSFWIAAVDPVDAEKVYLRTANNPDAPGRLILREKDPADPEKGVFRTIFDSKVPLDGFALSGDNTKVWIGSPLDGIWMARTTDYKFAPMSPTAVKCLAWAEDGLWACSNEAAKPLGFIVGVSTDDGATFTPKAHFCSIRGRLGCSPGSTTTELCDWPLMQSSLGCDPTAKPDGGFELDASSFTEDPGATTTTTTKSCDCQSVLSTNTPWTTVGGAAASLAAAVVAVLRRRRRR